MKEFLTMKRVKLLAGSLAVFFLAVHVVMFFIFRRFEVTPMVYLNIFSVAFYAAMIVLILLGRLYEFVLGTFLEVNFHMGAAIYYTGWGSGFQITLIALCILLAYSEYVGRSMKIKYVRFIFFAPLSMVTYLLSFYISLQRPAPYQLTEHVMNAFQRSWAVIVFIITIVVLQVFVYFTASSQEELSYEALYDKLTKIPNRFYMAEYLRKVFLAPDKSGYWLAITDLDDFKAVNDTYGHNCGDYVLVTIANLLNSPGMEVCRWGGEEFLLVGNKRNGEPMEMLQQIRQSIHDYKFQYEDKQLHLTMTIGMAWLQEGMSIDEWINAADKKLYEGKAAGKNRVCV